MRIWAFQACDHNLGIWLEDVGWLGDLGSDGPCQILKVEGYAP